MLDLRKNGSHILENTKIKIESVFAVENSLYATKEVLYYVMS
jgi:hypothetical protein